MIDLVTVLIELEENEYLHLARLLILLRKMGGRRGKALEGLTKLAKLEFLLRYPSYLKQALQAKGVDLTKVEIAEEKETSIESTMIRFRYGPWDPRHRRFINILIAMGLVEALESPQAPKQSTPKPVQIRLTPKGTQIADQFTKHKSFQDLTQRAALLGRHFNLSGETLKRFIYKTFPQISDLRYGEVIS